MEHCPSHDWDRYYADQERSAGLEWLAEVSRAVKQAYPYWNENLSENAYADDSIIVWDDGTRVIQAFNPDTLEPDIPAIVIRTLHKKGFELKVFNMGTKLLPENTWGIFVKVPEISWHVIPMPEDFKSQAKAEAYLGFAVSDRTGLETPEWAESAGSDFEERQQESWKREQERADRSDRC